MMANAMVGANSKTELLNSDAVIFILFSILGGLAPTSNKKPLVFRIHILHDAWCTLNSLLLVSASLASIEN